MLAWAPRLGRRLVWTRDRRCSSPPSPACRRCSPTTSTATSTTPGSGSCTASIPTSTRRRRPADPAFAHVTWTDTTSAYGPLFTLATYPLAWLPVGVAVYVLKAISAAAVLATAALVARLAPARGVDPLRAAAFVALNPLVLVHVVGGPHNDGLAMLLMTLGVAGVLTAREASGGAGLRRRDRGKGLDRRRSPLRPPRRCNRGRRAASGISRFRPVGRLLAGRGLQRCDRRGAYLGLRLELAGRLRPGRREPGPHQPPEHPDHHRPPNRPRPGPVRAAALTLYAALVIYLLVWTYRGADWLRAAAWATFGLLLATAWLLPWYLLWPLPLVALSRDRALQLLTLALTAYQLGARIPL